MTHPRIDKWIIVLVAIITLSSDTLLHAFQQDRDPSMPVATYGDARFRFAGWITSLSFSSDRKHFASSSYHWGTALWDAQTGELIQHFPASNRTPSQANFSPDGKLLFVTSADLKVWTVATGKLLYEIKNAGKNVRFNRLVQFTRDGKHFLAVGVGEVLFIETKTGRTVHRFETGDNLHRLNGVALSPDGSQAILGTYELLSQPTEGVATRATYAVKSWNLTSGKESLPKPHQEHFGETLKTIQFSPDGQSVVAITGKAHFQQKFQLLDPKTLKLQRVLKTDGTVWSHEYTPDGKLLAVGTTNTRNYSISLYDPANGELIRRWQIGAHGTGRGVVLAFSPDGKTIASAINEKPEVTLWDTATGKEKGPHDEGGASLVRRMAILGDGRSLVTQDEKSRVIRRDLKTGRVTQDQEWPLPGSDESMAMSTLGGELLSSDLKRLGNEPMLKDSQLMADVAKHRRLLEKAHMSANGKRVAVLFRPTRLNVYDGHSGKRLRQFGAAPYPKVPPTIKGLALSADGSRVAGHYGREKQVWNVDTGEDLTAVIRSQYHFAPDGTLVIVDRNGALLWDVDEAKTIAVLSDKPHPMGGAIAFSPDGRLMASARGFRSSEVVLWNLVTRKMIRVLRGVRGGAAALCFSPDGRTLCACDNSTATVVWDLLED